MREENPSSNECEIRDFEKSNTWQKMHPTCRPKLNYQFDKCINKGGVRDVTTIFLLEVTS